MVCLSDLVAARAVLLDIEAKDKRDLFSQMLEIPTKDGSIGDPEQVLTALLERESVMSTGIGRGVAVPHAQCRGARELTVTLGRMRTPLDFEAIDDAPVALVFLVTGPVQRGSFLQVLARISRLLCSEELGAALRVAGTEEKVVELIEQSEQALG